MYLFTGNLPQSHRSCNSISSQKRTKRGEQRTPPVDAALCSRYSRSAPHSETVDNSPKSYSYGMFENSILLKHATILLSKGDNSHKSRLLQKNEG